MAVDLGQGRLHGQPHALPQVVGGQPQQSTSRRWCALHEYKGALYGLPKDWDTIGFYFVNLTYLSNAPPDGQKQPDLEPDQRGHLPQVPPGGDHRHQRNNACTPKFNASSVATYGIDMQNAQVGYENWWQSDGCHIITCGLGLVDGVQHPGLRTRRPSSSGT